MANSFLDKTGLGLVWAQIKLLLAGKVDKVDGKGLSSNDYTADEKAKLANIQAGAEVNVNADWNAVTGDSAILNKPTIPTATSDLTNDSGFITSADVPTKVSQLMNDKGFITDEYIGYYDGTYLYVPKNFFERTGGQDYIYMFPFFVKSAYSVSINKDKYYRKIEATSNSFKIGMIFLDGVHQTSDVMLEPKNLYMCRYGSEVTYITTICSLSQVKELVDGVEIDVDDALDDVSTNPVANSVITNQLNTLSASIPTNNNQLTNGAGYQTASDVNSLIATAVGDLEGVDFEIVDTLPATGDKAKIYLVPLETSGTDNIYDEYIWIASSSTYEKIGTTDVDLSDYYNTTNLVPITSTEINTICQ